MSNRPRFIFFDIGNVLLHFDHERGCRQMAEVAGTSIDSVRTVVFDDGLQQRYELGEITSQEFYDHFCEKTRTQPDFEQLKHAGSAIFEMNVRMLPILAQLRASGHRLGLLSNTCEAHWDYLSDGRFSIFPQAFHAVVLSYQVGAMKPAPKIFEVAADVAKVPANEIFFSDDRTEHVAGAKLAGFDAVQFTTPDRLVEDLRSRGVEFNY